MRVFVIAVTVVVCLLPGLAAGQTVSAGVKGGIQWSSVDLEGLQATVDPGIGGVVGGFVEIGANRAISFRPEALMSWHRLTLTDDGQSIESGTTTFDIPLLICLRAVKASRVKGQLFGGPHISFITDAWQDLGTGGGRVDFGDAVEDVDAGATFGGGVEVPAGRGVFIVDARFNIGMRDMWKGADMSVKLRAFGVHAGYRF